MGGFSSFATAVSGMNAASAGLYVIGHNLANADTAGYVRQQVMQSDFFSLKIGTNATGSMLVGLGTDVDAIRQIRDKYLDLAYRQEASKLAFYQAKSDTAHEIDDIMGEINGQYKLSDTLNDMYGALNELSLIKNDMLDIECYSSPNFPEAAFRRLYRLYERHKKDNGTIDFDDMAYMCGELLFKRADLLDGLRSGFEYITTHSP